MAPLELINILCQQLRVRVPDPCAESFMFVIVSASNFRTPSLSLQLIPSRADIVKKRIALYTSQCVYLVPSALFTVYKLPFFTRISCIGSNTVYGAPELESSNPSRASASPRMLSRTLFRTATALTAPRRVPSQVASVFAYSKCNLRFASTVVKVPQMAESITEGTLKQFSKQVGDYVEADEEIATIETDKA